MSGDRHSDAVALTALVTEELSQDVPSETQILVDEIKRRYGDAVDAILFYGSCLRTGDKAGLMDLYVLIDDSRAYGNNAFSRGLHHCLPPYVFYCRPGSEAGGVHAKASVITRTQFDALCRLQAIDISVWARFVQPSALLYVRAEDTRAAIIKSLCRAYGTAMHWAVHFGPDEGRANDYWRALFRATYGAELRVEDAGRADEVVNLNKARYARFFVPALAAAGIRYSHDQNDRFRPDANNVGARSDRRAWGRRTLGNKLINFLRILKGAMTFEGGGYYVLWKLERRTGLSLDVKQWQLNHPFLAAPSVLFQMWRKGAFRSRR